MENPFKFKQIRQKLEQTKRTVPIMLAKQAEQHFTESFQNGGLDEYRWQEVNRRIEGTDEWKYPLRKGLSRRTKPILTMTGTLRRKVSRSISNATWNKVRLMVDLPYAKRHNDGLKGMPFRPFMKQTNNLSNLQKSLISQQIDKIWNS